MNKNEIKEETEEEILEKYEYYRQKEAEIFMKKLRELAKKEPKPVNYDDIDTNNGIGTFILH